MANWNVRPCRSGRHCGRCAKRPSLRREQFEHALAKHWAEILGLERVSIHDNFFELGGHSLIATQAVARIREAVGVELRLRALFDHPTIADLARVIEQMHSSGAAPAPPAGAPRPRGV